MDRQTREIVDLFCATSDGTPQDLQRCIARGCPWDKPLPARSTQRMFGTTTPTIPINIAAQYKRHENLAILATKALEAGRPELLESPNLEGHSPAYLAVQNGSPQCLGVMAKAGANLHRACPHIYQDPGPGNQLVDSTEDMPIHHNCNQTTLSFATRTCLNCYKGSSDGVTLKVCSQCNMAYFCSAECQKVKWKDHKKVCKKIKQGADLITFHDSMPKQSLVDESGFLPWDDTIDNDLELEEGEREEQYYDASKVWEYYDLSTTSWKPYPKCINQSIEGMRSWGPRYMYKPGDKSAEGLEERERTANPPPNVATNHVYYSHMIDHHIYHGCGRRIRRRVVG